MSSTENAETTETPVQNSPETQEETNLSELTTAELESYLRGGQAPESTAETPEPTAETQEPQASNPNAPEPALSDDESLAKMRVRPREARDQQVLDLYKSEGFDGTFEQAVSVIYGDTGRTVNTASAEQTDGEPPANPAVELDQRVSSLSEEIVALEKQVGEAAEELETGKALELQREISKKEMEITRIEINRDQDDRRAQEAQHNAYHTRAVESRDRALNQFPVLKDENSIERKQFDAFIADKQNDPDYSPIFNSPRWVEVMAREFASTRDLPSETPEAVRMVPASPNQTTTKASVLTSGGTQSVNRKITPDAILSNLDQIKTEDLVALLG
jgi:hypothetical protein